MLVPVTAVTLDGITGPRVLVPSTATVAQCRQLILSSFGIPHSHPGKAQIKIACDSRFFSVHEESTLHSLGVVAVSNIEPIYSPLTFQVQITLRDNHALLNVFPALHQVVDWQFEALLGKAAGTLKPHRHALDQMACWADLLINSKSSTVTSDFNEVCNTFRPLQNGNKVVSFIGGKQVGDKWVVLKDSMNHVFMSVVMEFLQCQSKLSELFPESTSKVHRAPGEILET